MAELKFEEALKKLETIVEGLEEGKISLEDSLKKYEEGIKLSKFCTEKLEEAEKKIEIFTKDSSGKLKKEPFKTNNENSDTDISIKENPSAKTKTTQTKKKTETQPSIENKKLKDQEFLF
jgi:exodeoxyribonuclease VII small subunit